MLIQGLICSASFLWSTEIFNIVTLSPNCNYGGKRSDGRDLCQCTINSLQSKTRMDGKEYKVTPVNSPGSTSGSSGEMGEFNGKDDKVSQEKLEADKGHSDKDVHNYTPQINEYQLHDAKPETVFFQEKDFNPGPENCSATTESSIRKGQMFKQGVIASNQRTALECFKEFTEMNNCNEPYLVTFPEPAITKDVTPANVSLASTSRETKGFWPMGVARKMKFEKVDAFHRSEVGMFGSTFNYNGMTSEMNKGKQPIIDVDDSKSSSNKKDDGLENFECISSRGIISTVKRARFYNFESELMRGKRLKKQNNDNCSFMNWVTTITNGLDKPYKDAPMEFFQHPSLHMKGIISPLSISEKEREIVGVSHGIMGFKSIFQNMCRHGYNVRSNINKYVDHQKELIAVKGTEGEKQDGCAELMTQSGHIFQKNLWITRYTHSLSSPAFKSVQCSDHKQPCLEVLTSRWSEKPQHNSVSHIDKPESKLQLTLSSEYCKKSEPMSSTFARRLDALMHTTTLNNVDEHTGANKICLFCGMSGHNIRECSEVVETRLEHYLKTMPMYDRNKEASCFCILCFHLDHWAVACPNVSSKGNLVTCSTTFFGDVNLRNTPEIHRNDHFADHDGVVMFLSGSKKDHHQVENKATGSDFLVSTNVGCHKNESACCRGLDLHMNRDEDVSNTDKMKVTASFSSQNEVKMFEFTPFCSHLSTKIASEPEGIFGFVRKLRLSRKDIIRWMKSSAPHIDLTGFFLRLRIGKLEKGLGGTGYHVACINGAASYQSSIIACVGSSAFSVTSRFISNQDFDEDELNTWWFQKQRDGSKIPSTEELNEKLQLRIKLEF